MTCTQRMSGSQFKRCISWKAAYLSQQWPKTCSFLSTTAMDTTKAMILELLVQAKLQGSTAQSSCLRSKIGFSFYDWGWMSDAQLGPFRPPPADANRIQWQLRTLSSIGSTMFLFLSWWVYRLDLLARSLLVMRPSKANYKNTRIECRLAQLSDTFNASLTRFANRLIDLKDIPAFEILSRDNQAVESNCTSCLYHWRHIWQVSQDCSSSRIDRTDMKEEPKKIWRNWLIDDIVSWRKQKQSSLDCIPRFKLMAGMNKVRTCLQRVQKLCQNGLSYVLSVQ